MSATGAYSLSAMSRLLPLSIQHAGALLPSQWFLTDELSAPISSLLTLPLPVDPEGCWVSPPSGMVSCHLSDYRVSLGLYLLQNRPHVFISAGTAATGPSKDTEPRCCCVRHKPQAGFELLIFLTPLPKSYDYSLHY